MSNLIKLNDKVGINLGKLVESRLLVQANSGGGKSWANRRIIEQAFDKVQIIVIDPEGEFGNMRGKYDFIYIGKDGDAPAEARSAALLAHRLLETKASAIIDIYEMNMNERRHFVKLFFDAMVNAPKNLWHDCLIILDEAHKFAPEKEQSEALESVADMASRGRKRGYCLIPSTQRPAKLNKDVAAECNNKLIGRASLDIDRKRSAEELGFTSKEEVLSLRNLEPGEFYAFGPAISRDIIKTTIGDVKVKPAARGQGKKSTPAPTEKVKKILSQFKDLPQEAKKEASTVAELKQELFKLRTHKCPVLPPPPSTEIIEKIKKEVEDFVADANKKLEKSFDEEAARFQKKESETIKSLTVIKENLDRTIKTISANNESRRPIPIVAANLKSLKIVTARPMQIPTQKDISQVQHTLKEGGVDVDLSGLAPITGGAMRMLKVLASRYPIKLSKVQLATFAHLKSSSGTFSTYLSTLKGSGLIVNEGDMLMATQAGIDAIGEAPNPPQTSEEVIQLWKNNLTGGARRMFDTLVRDYPTGHSKESLANDVGIVHTSGTFNTYLSTLKSNNLIEIINGELKAADHLFNL